MKAAVSVSLGLVFVGLATLNVITIFESSRLGRAPRSRARAIALHRAGLSLHRPVRADGVVHEQASNWLARRNLRRCRSTHRPCRFACSTSLPKSNHRAQIQKLSFDFDAAWIVDFCYLCRARTDPRAPVRVGKNQSFKFDCEIFAGTYCLVLRVYGPFSTSPATFFVHQNSITFIVLPVSIET